MRSFVIVSPGLSIGRPGSHVTAEYMRMDDDKLDEFVEAGHAIEVFQDGERPRGVIDAPDDTPLDDLAAPKPRKAKAAPPRPATRGRRGKR